jgi:calcineurin-like phosphoesterase family protein
MSFFYIADLHIGHANVIKFDDALDVHTEETG